MNSGLRKLKLKFNPFEPSASGAPTGIKLWLPERWRSAVERILDAVQQGHGPKAIAIRGEYGSGKTYLLSWLATDEFPSRRIQSYYFDNPGVQFYDLANSLLRQIGRLNFSKSLWEFLNPNISGQRSLFERKIPYWMSLAKGKSEQIRLVNELQDLIIRKSITDDEEIAQKFARLIVETRDKPFFEYRDFVAGHKGALVAEREEAPYFKAILRTLRYSQGTEAISFLIDEFEEIALQKRLTRRDAHDYFATLKRLFNLAKDENFWVVVAMTPQSEEVTKQMEPAFWDRFTTQGQYVFNIPPLTGEDARLLIENRLAMARETEGVDEGLFPFPGNFDTLLKPTTRSSPRQLVKVAFYCLAEAASSPKPKLPFSLEFIQEIEKRTYPDTGKETPRPKT